MPVEIKLPQLGESIHEGTIARWLKKPGDRVEKYEPLVEITTDKVNVEMPSPFAGTLVEFLAAEGDTRPVGSPIALIDASGAAAGTSPVPEAAAGAPTAAVQASAGGEPAVVEQAAAVGARTVGVRLSPLVRRLAEEHAIPLDVIEALPGTGSGGRITKDDVLRYVEERSTARPAAPARPVPSGAPPPAAASVAAAPAGPVAAAEAPPRRPGDEIVKLSPIRRSIAQRMAQSKREIPHAYGVIEVDMSAVAVWREAHKDTWRTREGSPLTYTAFFVRAACEALRAFPLVNSAWSAEGIIRRKGVHIGIGIAVEDGLVVPVIHDADQLSLAGITRALDDLSTRARAGHLGLDDIQGGTFTITNPGVFGSIWSMPIIVPGQAAILATDAIVKRAVVRDDAIAIRPVMHLGMSFDHRIFDGAASMQFLNHMKGWFEDFRDGR